MQTLSLPTSTSTSRPALWTSRILAVVLVLFMAFDTIVKVIQRPEAVEPTVQFGFAASFVVVLGLIELACLVLYLIPRTSVLGAILLTGYLGGAVATQLRVGAAPFSIVFPIIMGAIAWGVLYLQNEQLRALVPFRKSNS